MSRSGPLLLTTGIEDHRPLGALGEPVYLAHRKIAAAVQARLGESFSDYFARPEVDTANRRIDWHATVDGDVRKWTELSAEEQAALAPRVDALRNGFESFVADLDAKEDSSRAEESFSRVLRQAIQSPGLSTLFFVGDQPVLTLWGFEGEETGFDTLAFDFKAAPPAAAPPVTPPPGATAAPVASRPWWRWLWWLLPLLLLLLLLFFLLRGCEDDLALEEPREELAPEEEAAEEEEPLPPDVLIETVPGAVGVAPVTGVEGEAQPGAEALPEGEAPAIEDPADPPPPSEPESETPPDQEPPPEETPPEETPPEETPPEETPPEETPPEETPPEETPPEETPPEETPPEDPAAEPPLPEPLTIPPQQNGAPGSVDFMRGQWKSDSGLVDEATGQPLEQTYEFEDSGEGEVVIRRQDGTQCRGPAKALRTDGGGVRIEESGPLACDDGSSFTPSVTECQPDTQGRAVCRGLNPDGSEYNVEITR